MANELPLMICAQCTRPIEVERGYFSSWVAFKRSDFHVNCRPQLTYSKERREDIDQEKLRKLAGRG